MQLPLSSRPGRAAALACMLPLAAAWAQQQPVAPTRPIALGAAVALALQGNANLRIARAQWEGARGAAQEQQGIFDPLWTTQAQADRGRTPLTAAERATLAAAGVGASDRRAETRGVDTSIQKLFGNGVQATVSAGHANVRDDQLAWANQPRQNLGVLHFELRVPLARGSGTAVGVPQRVAEAQARAAEADLQHAAAQTVLAAAQAYWSYAGQLQREAIALAGERRGDALLEELRKLVAADEIPRAELQLAQASLSERRSARFAAQQAVLEARRTLGRVLGLDTPSLLAIGPASDGFPLPPRDVDDTPVPIAADAVARRADFQALRERRAAALLRIEAARDVGRPRVDLLLGATRNSLGEGARSTDLGASFQSGAPPGATVGVIYQLPLGTDNTAQGLLRQQLAAADALEAEQRELADSIESAGVAAEFGVRRAGGQLREAELAVRTYATSVENERTKRRLGMATLIDVLAVEDRYQGALLAAVQARVDYALAIARLRFENATLVTAQGEGHQARVDALLNPASR